MKHRLIALGLLASAVGLAQAQSTRQLYLVKGKKVVATFPASDVDFITFDGTQQFYLGGLQPAALPWHALPLRTGSKPVRAGP